MKKQLFNGNQNFEGWYLSKTMIKYIKKWESKMELNLPANILFFSISSFSLHVLFCLIIFNLNCKTRISCYLGFVLLLSFWSETIIIAAKMFQDVLCCNTCSSWVVTVKGFDVCQHIVVLSQNKLCLLFPSDITLYFSWAIAESFRWRDISLLKHLSDRSIGSCRCW